MTIFDRARAEGWTLEHTGGGCTALRHESPAGGCWLIVDPDTMQAPIRRQQSVRLVGFNGAGEEIERIETTFEDALNLVADFLANER